MKRILTALSLTALLVCVGWVGFHDKNKKNTQAKVKFTKEEEKLLDRQVIIGSFEPIRKMLLKKGVPFEPRELLEPNWQTKIAPKLGRMREMQEAILTTDKVSGVKIADRIFIPEKTTITDDTVIIANSVIFEGRSAVMEGYGGKIYLFPIQQSGLLGKSLVESMRDENLDISREAFSSSLKSFTPKLKKGIGGITIRMNGFGWHEWRRQQDEKRKSQSKFVADKNSSNQEYTDIKNGSPGQKGDDGVIGLPGDLVSPTTAPRGGHGHCRGHADGYEAVEGFEGNTGKQGTKGKIGYIGGGGGQINLAISPPYGAYTLEVIGGTGGQGGTGGEGGPGSKGMNGNKGGDGADCRCEEGGTGNGGKGGDGGKGGKGGDGNTGGPGGPGGPGGIIVITAPSDFQVGRILHRERGGHPGEGGEGGPQGSAGPSGDFGAGGNGALNTYCPSDFGDPGPHGRSMANLGHGNQGDNGPRGTVEGDNGQFYFIQDSGGGGEPPPPITYTNSYCTYNWLLIEHWVSYDGGETWILVSSEFLTDQSCS